MSYNQNKAVRLVAAGGRAYYPPDVPVVVGSVWCSVSEAARATKIHRSQIQAHLDGRLKMARGCVFERVVS
jgi:hypothetical protein